MGPKMIFTSPDIRTTIDWSSGNLAAAATDYTFATLDFGLELPLDVTLTGTAGDDLLEGGDGDDDLKGFAGNDTLLGHLGNDTLIGGAGDDSLRAGDNDHYSWLWNDPSDAIPYAHNLLDGGLGNDTLIGSPVIDTLIGGGGDDWIETGASSEDLAQGGTGNDTITGTGTLYGEAGDDRLIATGSDATLKGGSGTDELVAFQYARLFGGADGDRFVFAQSGSATIEDWQEIDRFVVEGRHISDGDVQLFLPSGAQNDPTKILVPSQGGYGLSEFEITGGLGQTLFAVTYDGADTVLVAYERTALTGTIANDLITGTSASERIDGGGGLDTMVGAGGNDLFVADLGRATDVISDFTFDEDRIDLRAWGVSSLSEVQISYLSPQSAVIRSVSGHVLRVDAPDGQYTQSFVARDFLFAEASSAAAGGQWVDTTSEADILQGNAEGLIIDGGAGLDSLTGSSADDSLFGGDGNDTLNGADGNDFLLGDAGYDRLLGGAGADTLLGLLGRDTLLGGNGADVLDGGVDHDDLFGGAGHDHLLGRFGDDRLFGGKGSDTLDGGNGSDVFVMRAVAEQGQDVVTRFELGVDQIELQLAGRAVSEVTINHANDGDLYTLITFDGLESSLRVNTVHLSVEDLTLV